MAVIERDGPQALTFRRLGTDLGADHTAVLRHFRGKDDLLLGLAARLVSDALHDFAPSESWRETLASLARRIRAACLHHPGVAALVATRTSRREPEFQSADVVIGALLKPASRDAKRPRTTESWPKWHSPPAPSRLPSTCWTRPLRKATGWPGAAST